MKVLDARMSDDAGRTEVALNWGWQLQEVRVRNQFS
jgi:hypothetical protein